jgi:hypothetical protein
MFVSTHAIRLAVEVLELFALRIERLAFGYSVAYNSHDTLSMFGLANYTLPKRNSVLEDAVLE